MNYINLLEVIKGMVELEFDNAESQADYQRRAERLLDYCFGFYKKGEITIGQLDTLCYVIQNHKYDYLGGWNA